MATQQSSARKTGSARAKARVEPVAVEEFLTVETILQASDREPEIMQIPEWGGQVELTPLTAGQQSDVRKRATVAGNIDDDLFALHLVVEGISKPRFSPEHVALLREKQAGVVESVAERVLVISGMNRGAMAAAEALFRALSGDGV